MAGVPSHVQLHAAQLDLLAQFTDPICITAALGIAVHAYPEAWQAQDSAAAALAVLLFYCIGHARRLYRSWQSEPLRSEFVQVWVCWAYVVPLLLLAAFVTKTSVGYSRFISLTWFAVTPVLISGWRLTLRSVLQRVRVLGDHRRRVAVVGASVLGEEIARSVKHSPAMGMILNGVYDDRHVSRLDPVEREAGPIIGNFDQLVAAARTGAIDVVYITLPLQAERRINQLIRRLQDTTASVYLACDFGIVALRSNWRQIGNVAALCVVEDTSDTASRITKRLEDLILSAMLLVAFSLPMLVIGLLVKLTSRGPAMWRERRFHLTGKEVRVLKFRTSHVEPGCDGPPHPDQERRTAIGMLLRRTCLDQLPQFFDVLSGTLSIVGPRPHSLSHTEQYRALAQGARLRHRMKPGITCLAQVKRPDTDMDHVDQMQKRVEDDFAYGRDWALLTDLKIIVMTATSIMRGREQYYYAPIEPTKAQSGSDLDAAPTS
jgi:putative colanic acid biosynthesis UDP-glucose lipid carrier transferase